MKFEVYNYQCSPLSIEEGFFTGEAEMYRKKALHSMEHHLEIIDSLLMADQVYYPYGSLINLNFKEDNMLRLIRKNTRKHKSANDELQKELSLPYLKALMLYAKDGFYVMSVQNKTLVSKEKEWSKLYDINEPSCFVIIANTEGRQLLLVEANGAFGRKNNNTTRSVCSMFQDSFKALLKEFNLDINFRPHYRTDSVWDFMKEKYRMGIALKSLSFEIDYPNMAADAKLLKGCFEEIGIDLNAQQKYSIVGHHGQALNFDPMQDDRNKNVDSLIEYSGSTGNKQEHKYMDNTKMVYSANKVGITTISANGVIYNALKQLLEEVTENNQRNYVLFEQASDTLRDEIARWINPLVRQSDC